MIKRIAAALFFLIVFMLSVSGQQKAPVKGMLIKKSIQFRKGIYHLQLPVLKEDPLIIIEGKNITVDFNDLVLDGAKPGETPDQFHGVAVLVRNSSHVTLKNVSIRGYKVAIKVIKTDHLVMERCDGSYNYRQHLNSTPEKEDLSDWMSYHHNEQDEWLRYGAAFYLRGCDSVLIRDCRVTGGQNGLMMTESNGGMIINNDFSFNSGIGIGMYRSSGNNVMYNRIIFNVRGYSHGVYNRGQDSAGILVYEQSSHNLFYKNAVTHGGDGFFLWAGQSTMDNGQGGCNDNILMNNDFSWAPTNGVEVTFSRNTISDNRIFGCDHGIWGGYSYNSTISNNKFRDNRIDIAIEHGQENEITYNIFYDSKEAMRLWARTEQPSDWGYAKARDTKSRDYIIAYNNFSRVKKVLNVNHTDGLHLFGNLFGTVEQFLQVDSTVTGIDSVLTEDQVKRISSDSAVSIPEVKDPYDPFKGAGRFAGRQHIIVGEWGPYDYRYPLAHQLNVAEKSDTIRLGLLGPAGKWQLGTLRGARVLDPGKGVFPDTVLIVKDAGAKTDVRVQFLYKGEAFTDPFGNKVAAGKAVPFVYRKYFQPLDWNVLFYPMDTMQYNPVRTGTLFSPTARMAPFKEEKADRLEYAWWGGIKAGNVQHVQFITQATATAVLEAGEYELDVTWDDAVRVYVDEKMVLNEWNPGLYKFDESPHKKLRLKLGGEHHFRVEHLELGGFATLSLKINKLQ